MSDHIITHVVRQPRGQLANRMAEVGEDSICTSIAVAVELRYGAE